MPFEELPQTPTAEELLDKAFSRAARSGRAKSGTTAQQSMVQTAGNILVDNLQNVVRGWPDIDGLHPFHRELAATLVDLDAVRQQLGNVEWAASTIADLRGEYQGRLRRTDADTARKHRKQAFARFADIVEEIDDDLQALREAAITLQELPEIDPEVPTIVVAGYPNVGKTSFVNAVTRTSNRTASYPFTTTGILVGHLDWDHIRYQLIDTPGLLDRPPSERNEIERQAVAAISHVASCVLVLIDPSETCGYQLEKQRALRDEVRETFDDIPVLTVGSKADLERTNDVDIHMSVEEGNNLESVLELAIESIDFEPELPFDS